MTRLDEWLAAQADKQRRRPALEEALLGGRFWRYARQRLTGFAASRLFAVVIHLVELLVLSQLFSSRGFAVSLLLVNGCQLAAAFWWGCLEVLRTRVRTYRTKAEAQREAGKWLGRAAILAALVLAAPLLVSLASAAHRRLDPLHVFAWICCLRLAIDLLARTLYSAVYAVHRVFRPLATIVAAEAVGLVATAALYRFLGPWVFPIGMFLSVVLSRALAVAYTLKAFRAHRLPVPRIGLRAACARPRQPLVVLTAGLSSLSMRLGSIVVFLLVLGRGLSTGPHVLVAHVIAPVLLAAAIWPQVFYLDLKRLDTEAARVLRERLERALRPLSLLVGAGLWLVGAGALGWAGVNVPARGLLALLPLFLAQAYLAGLQLARFTSGRHGSLLAASLVLAAMLAGAWRGTAALGGGAAAQQLALAGAMLAGAVVLQLWQGRRRAPTSGCMRSLPTWLQALAGVDRPVHVATALLPRARQGQVDALASWLAAELGASGAVLAKNRRLLWFTDSRPVAPSALVVVSGGLVDDATEAAAPDGATATATATRWLGMASPGGGAADLPQLLARFNECFPEGLEADVAGGRLAGLPPQARQAVWIEALAAADGVKTRRGQADYEVTVYRPEGVVCHLFLVPRRAAAAAQLRAWRDLLDSASSSPAAADPVRARRWTGAPATPELA